MTNKRIKIQQSRKEILHFLSNEEAQSILKKGWTLSYVYSLVELRDVFLAIKRHGQNGISYKDFSNKYIRGIIPYSKKEWDEKGRRYLEIRNALVNFGLICPETFECSSDFFKDDTIPGSPLTQQDVNAFKQIYFSYFRFKEMASLFINPQLESSQRLQISESQLLYQSKPIFAYISQRGYTDTFFYELNQNPELFILQETNEDAKYISGLQRFWDVFISWGIQLHLIEKFNMKSIGCFIENSKTFTCNYIINPLSDIDIERFISKKYSKEKLIDIAELVFYLCFSFRISIATAQQKVIQYHIANPESTSLLRTSEIFIKSSDFSMTDKILYPKYKDSYVSHIKLR